MLKACLSLIFVVSIFLLCGAKKAQISHPMPGKFIVRTSEKKSLEDMLSQYLVKFSNTYEKILVSPSTVSVLDDNKGTADYIPLGQIYHRSGKNLNSRISPGRFSIWLGKAPLVFTLERHLWQTRSCETQWVCENSQIVQKIRIIRRAGLDYQDRFFVSIRLMGLKKYFSDLKKTYSKELLIKFDNTLPKLGQWKMRIRDPDGRIKEINSKSLEFEFPFDQKSKEFLIEAVWLDKKKSDEKMSSRPISSLQTFTKKWVVKTFPAFDCPEPWLNKLWYAQIYAINSQVSFLPDVYDSDNHIDPFWLKDRRISITQKEKNRKSAMYRLDSYDDFLKWCRSFYSKDDFDKIPDISVDAAASKLNSNLPVGVIDMVVTKLIGLKPASEKILKIEPASWIGHWPYFAIDNLPYFDHNLTIVWQQESKIPRYENIETGFSVFVDEKLALHCENIEPLNIELK